MINAQPAVQPALQPLTILGIPGSVRSASLSRAALVAAQRLLPEQARLEIFDLEGLPPFNQDMAARPAARVTEFKRRIREADAVLFSAPEYLHSILAVLNNAIDSASWPCGENAWHGKPVAVMGVSDDPLADGHTQYRLRHSVTALGMLPVEQPEVLIRNARHAFDWRGRLIDASTQAMIRHLLHGLVDGARRLRQAPTATPFNMPFNVTR
jgi:chromate reductase